MGLKILGQLAPSASGYESVYAVPLKNTAVVSSIVICNTHSTNYDYIRISVRNGNAPDSSKDKIYYNLPVGPNDTFIATIGATLDSGDRVYVWAQNGTCSFNLFGQENS